MKKLALKLAGGTAVAAAFVMASATGASASNNYSYDHDGNRSHSYNSNWHENDYGSGRVHYAKYNDNNYNNYGMWYGGQWYSYNQMGYTDQWGRWICFRSDWNQYDWYMWRSQRDCD